VKIPGICTPCSWRTESRESGVASISGQHDAIKSNPAKFSNQFIPLLFYFIFASWLWSPLQSVGKGIPLCSELIRKSANSTEKAAARDSYCSPRSTPFRTGLVPPFPLAAGPGKSGPACHCEHRSSRVSPHLPPPCRSRRTTGNILSPELTNENNFIVKKDKKEEKRVFYGFWVQNRMDWHV
jgi:hypothetical protein